MTPTDTPIPISAPSTEASDPVAGRCAVATGYADFVPLEIAITGYMKDRNDLVAAFAGKNNAYPSHSQDQNKLAQEIERIDRAVAALLHNTHRQTTPPESHE